MEISGKLRDDILKGNAVLFLGAGIGVAAGLHGAKELSNYLFHQTGSHTRFEKHKDKLAKLVAQLDKDSQFTRKWTNEKLKHYFLNDSNYKSLEPAMKLLGKRWKAIFTTNYDLVIEMASDKVEAGWRLLPITDPKNRSLMVESGSGKLKYYKIHGCIDDLDRNPATCIPLVITQQDFIRSIKQNKVFWNELERYALNSSIIFVGFNVQQVENNHILSGIFEAQTEVTRNFEQPYAPFAVLPHVNEETREDLEGVNVNLLEGTFEKFVEAINTLKEPDVQYAHRRLNETLRVKAAKSEIKITRYELNEYNKQFFFYYQEFFKEERNKYDSLIPEKKIDAWKSQPSRSFIYSGNWITRSQFPEAMEALRKLLSEIAEKRSPRLLVLGGKRACGKTIFAHQLAYEVYKSLRNPVLFLKRNASYIEHSPDTEKENIVSGWNSRIFDKFLSLFHNERTSAADLIPIIVADHVSYRQNSLDSFIKNLANHGKPVLLILTLNEDELNEEFDKVNTEKSIKLSQLYSHRHFMINHRLDDAEIESLFTVIARDFPHIATKRDILVRRARDVTEANRDLLLILYQWFDQNFRRLDEIILEESAKLDENVPLKRLYLSIAAFYQYNLQPPIQACTKAADISILEYMDLKGSPLFKACIDVLHDDDNDGEEYGFSRHPEYSRRIFERLCPSKDSQNAIIRRVLNECLSRDLLFVRSFFNYLYEIDVRHTVEEVTEFKKATETDSNLRVDPILNHQFGAYLIRENADLKDARYYLDIALEEDPENSTIIHSIGNLNYRLFKNDLEDGNRESAFKHYELAKSLFERNRSLNRFTDEHGYVTDILMTRHRRNNSNEDAEKRVQLAAESDALFFEALRIIPPENQNYLVNGCHSGKRFMDLSQDEKDILIDKINSGDASGSLIQYYASDLLNNPKPKNWLRHKNLVVKYFDSNDPKKLIPVAIISKRAFIKSAENRFERLRTFFDDLVRYGQEQISFVLISEYVRLLIVDAFVLGKYRFIVGTISDIRNKVFIRTFPRFLKDEYVLESGCYRFDESDEESLKQLFVKHSTNFDDGEKAKLYNRIVHLGPLNDSYTNIEIDQATRFWVRAIRKEIATSTSKAHLSFKIKHSWDGLKATDFIT